MSFFLLLSDELKLCVHFLSPSDYESREYFCVICLRVGKFVSFPLYLLEYICNYISNVTKFVLPAMSRIFVFYNEDTADTKNTAKKSIIRKKDILLLHLKLISAFIDKYLFNVFFGWRSLMNESNLSLPPSINFL